MIAFFFLADLMLLGRLFVLRADGSRGWKWCLAVTIVQAVLALMVLEWPVSWLWVVLFFMALAILTAVPAFVTRGIEERLRSRLVACLVTLVLSLTVVGVFTRSTEPDVSEGFLGFANLIRGRLSIAPLIERIDWLKVLAHAFGILLCLSESSNLVRMSLEFLNVRLPKEVAPKFRHSAEIGAIERILIYIFAFHAAFNAVAFVLTAKSVARVHELSTTDAAEYVLLGTLISTLIGIALGLLINGVLMVV